MKFEDQYVIRSEVFDIEGTKRKQHTEQSLFEAIQLRDDVRRVLDSGADVYIHSTNSPCSFCSERIASFEKGESQTLLGNDVTLTKSKQTFLAYDKIYKSDKEGNPTKKSKNQEKMMKENLSKIPNEKHFYISSVREDDKRIFWSNIKESIEDRKQQLDRNMKDGKSF